MHKIQIYYDPYLYYLLPNDLILRDAQEEMHKTSRINAVSLLLPVVGCGSMSAVDRYSILFCFVCLRISR